MNFIGMEQGEFEKLQKKLDEIKEDVSVIKQQKALGQTYMDIASVCQMLHISKRLLYEWRMSGRLPFIQISGKIFFKACDIDSYFELHYIKGKRK